MFQLGVILQPSSSEALCHLGSGQLSQYDATNENVWLCDSEQSYRASIALEGKIISTTLVPEQLKKQDWWKKTQEAPAPQTADKNTSQTKPTASNQKQSAPSKQPAVTSQRKPTSQPNTRAAQPNTTKSQVPSRTTAGAQVVKKPVGGKTASVKPSGPGKPGQAVKPSTSAGNKGVATLGVLKSGTQKKVATANDGVSTQSKPQGEAVKTQPTEKPISIAAEGKGDVNKCMYHPRLGLARALARTSDTKKHNEAHGLYREVISMVPELHDAYIELGEMLAKTSPVEAVDVYSRFPFSNPPTFDDAYLHGEIVQLLMSSENYDDPRLCSSMIAMGKALGIGVLEKQVSVLENKFKSSLLKQIYAGVHGKSIDDSDLQAFFKFKVWL